MLCGGRGLRGRFPRLDEVTVQGYEAVTFAGSDMAATTGEVWVLNTVSGKEEMLRRLWFIGYGSLLREWVATRGRGREGRWLEVMVADKERGFGVRAEVHYEVCGIRQDESLEYWETYVSVLAFLGFKRWGER